LKKIIPLFFLLFQSLLPTEWNRFRGPNGTGVVNYPFINTKWIKEDFIWGINLPGTGHSSPVIWKDKVFTTCADEKKGEIYILCIDSQKGTITWQKTISFNPYSNHKFNSYSSCTPCVDPDYLFVSWTTPYSNNLACFDHKGHIVWEKNFGEYKTQHGSGFSPIVHKDKLIVCHDHEEDSAIIALNRNNGKIVWKTERKGSKPSASTPFILESENDYKEVIASSMSHGCYSVNFQNGKILWETGPGTLNKRAVSSPIQSDKYIFATCGSGSKGSRLISVQHQANDPKLSSLFYSITRDVPYVPTPLVLGSLILLLSDGGIVACMKRESGNILWRQRVKGNYFASPIAVNDKIMVISTEGTVSTLKINHKKMDILSTIELNDLTHNTPAVTKEKIFFRTNSKLFCLPLNKEQL